MTDADQNVSFTRQLLFRRGEGPGAVAGPGAGASPDAPTRARIHTRHYYKLRGDGLNQHTQSFDSVHNTTMKFLVSFIPIFSTQLFEKKILMF